MKTGRIIGILLFFLIVALELARLREQRIVCETQIMKERLGEEEKEELEIETTNDEKLHLEETEDDQDGPEPAIASSEKQDDILLSNLRAKALDRIKGLELEHIANNQSYAVGMRGVSWIYANLNGTLLAAPELEKLYLANKVVGGKIVIDIRDISKEQKCNAEKASLISIWVRLAGPEIVSRMAKSIPGECRWIAEFQIHAPGSYTAYARLLHFNGGQDSNQECVVVHPSMLATLKLQLLEQIPIFPYQTPDFVCCQMCDRIPDCVYSIQGWITDIAKYGAGRQCNLFRQAHDEETNYIPGLNLTDRLNIDPKLGGLRYSPNRAKAHPVRSIWQLGCGREEMLMRWAGCGSYGAPNNSYMTGVEDVVLFEHEHRGLLVDPKLDGTIEVTEEAAQAELENGKKPICDWSSLQIPNFAQGRWVTTPPERLMPCGPMQPFEVRQGYIVCPDFPSNNDPICFNRFYFENLVLDGIRFQKQKGFGRVWRSELSDNYFRSANTRPYVRGPWAGYWHLPPSSTCRLPPPRSPQQIRECLLKKKIGGIQWLGRSVMIIQTKYLDKILRAAFPNKMEYDNLRLNTTLLYGANATFHEAVITNLAAPHILPLTFKDRVEKQVAEMARSISRGKAYRVWFSAPFTAWERRMFLTAERAYQLQAITRKEFQKYRWYEIDYLSLTQPFVYDASTDMDTLHYIGTNMVIVSQLFFDVICRTDPVFD